MLGKDSFPVRLLAKIHGSVNVRGVPELPDQTTKAIHTREFNDRQVKLAVGPTEFINVARCSGRVDFCQNLTNVLEVRVTDFCDSSS